MKNLEYIILPKGINITQTTTPIFKEIDRSKFISHTTDPCHKPDGFDFKPAVLGESINVYY